MSKLARWSWFRASFIALSFVATFTTAANADTIRGLHLNPAQALTGTNVSATATGTGSGLCGAVHIDWGDGSEATTYATTTLPYTQSHVYQAPGTFTVRAEGMGNCDGHATARITITAPPPAKAPPPAPRLSAIEISPPAAAPRAPVTISLRGTGSCRVAIDFGDGNSQELGGALPLSVRHVYALAGRYTIVATPAAPCGDRQTAALVVGNVPRAPMPRAPRVRGIEVTRVPGAAGGMRAITVTGDGRCAYTLDYGDGNSEPRSAALPDVVQHNYPLEGRYTIVATATPPCSGVLQTTTVIGSEAKGRVSRIDVRPSIGRPNQLIALTIAGSGSCRFTVDFGDGESRGMTETLPHRLTYRYAEPGDYEIVVWTEQPCTGEANAALRVRGR